MLEQKFYSIMIMEDRKKCNSEDLIDENLDIANQTLEVLKNQEKQLNDVEDSLFNIEYYSRKSKDILKRMEGFFKRLWYRPVEVDETRDFNVIQMDAIEHTNYGNMDILDKLGELKNVGLKIGESLDNQNKILDKLDVDVDKNKSYINKNNRKINNLL